MSDAAERISDFSGKATNALKGIIAFIKDGDFTTEFARST